MIQDPSQKAAGRLEMEREKSGGTGDRSKHADPGYRRSKRRGRRI